MKGKTERWVILTFLLIAIMLIMSFTNVYSVNNVIKLETSKEKVNTRR